MHFEQPELLYALILLVIPLIVHLFRLRRFQKEDFTNVKFLKKVIQETRKSSRLKKFLILVTRLLLLACIILAFAKPFIPASDEAMTETRTLIYLDNSFSMQAGENQNTNFQKSINPILELINSDDQFAVFTNTDEYYDRTIFELREEIQAIPYSEKQLNFKEIAFRAEDYFKNYPYTNKELVIISDFQSSMEIPASLKTSEVNYHLVQQKADIFNVAIDSAFLDNATPESLELKIQIKANRNSEKPISVSVFNGEQLLGRNTIDFSSIISQELIFRLQPKPIANGRIVIEDSGLKYDNQLFFTIESKPGIKVVILSNSDTDFLDRIYTQPEFEIVHFSPQQIDFNAFNQANLIILNEIEQVPSSLLNNLATVKNKGASVIIIPSIEAQGYDTLLSNFGFSGFSQKVNTERLITSIVFDHPLLQSVFEDRIENFEYPKVLSSFNLNSSNIILKFQDNKPFLAEKGSVYLFSAAINDKNSNFKNSPLIVPVFYQIGLNALKQNQLYFETSNSNRIDIPVELGKDQVLHIKNAELDIIPQQQNYSNHVEIITDNIDLPAGNFEITNNTKKVSNLSFNYSRQESELNFIDVSSLKGAKKYRSVDEYFSELKATTQITTLWKWFVIFAIIFLAIEMLLIKFLK